MKKRTSIDLFLKTVLALWLASFGLAASAAIVPREQRGAVLGQLDLERSLEERMSRGLLPILGEGKFAVQVLVRLAPSQTGIGGNSPMPQPIVLNNAPNIPILFPQNNATPFPQTLDDAEAADEQPSEVLPGMPMALRPLRTRSQIARSAPLPPATPPPPIVPPSLAIQAPAERPQSQDVHITSIRAVLYLDRSVLPASEDFARTFIDKILLAYTPDESVDLIRREMIKGTKDAPLGIGYALVGSLLLLLLCGLAMVLLRRKVQQVSSSPAPGTLERVVPRAGGTSMGATNRSRFLLALMEQPEGATRIARHRLGQPGGVAQLAAIFQNIGPLASAKAFRGLVAEERAGILEEFAAKTFSEQEIDEAIEDFQRELAAESIQILSEDPLSQTFDFLRRLSENQLLFTLEEEGPNVRALALSQIPAERAAIYLSGLPEAERKAVAKAISELDQIPLPFYQEVAEVLAARSSQAPRFVPQDGVSTLLGVLDSADPDTERHILSALAQGNPEILRKVQSRYLTLEDLPRIAPAALKEAMREISQAMDRHQVAKALAQATEESRGFVLDVLPSRSRVMLQDALDDASETPPSEEEALRARREFLSQLRSHLKSGQFFERE